MKQEDIFNCIQANILKPHNRNHTLLLFFTWKEFKDKQVSRDWVIALGQLVTSHQQQLDNTKAYIQQGTQSHVVNLGLTPHAMRSMGLEHKVIDREFKDGMLDRKQVYFGSPYRKPPKHIDGIDNVLLSLSHPHHVFLTVAHDDKKELEKFHTRLLTNSTYMGLLEAPPTYLYIKQKRYPPKSGEIKGRAKGPLGFEDNISIVNDDQLLLKHAFNYDGASELRTTDFGTYLAIQKIQLHTSMFEERAKELAQKLKAAGRKEANIALGKALMIGRFPNGTPLALADQATNVPRNEENNFDYKSDDLGSKCPLHAHIRSANPRTPNNQLVPIIRRSILYDDIRGKEQDESLLFMSFQASIKDNLLPVYKRLLTGMSDSTFKADALLYSGERHPDMGKGKPLKYYRKYGTNDQVSEDDEVKFDRVGQDLTTIVSGAFYYCPSKTFLDDPK